MVGHPTSHSLGIRAHGPLPVDLKVANGYDPSSSTTRTLKLPLCPRAPDTPPYEEEHDEHEKKDEHEKDEHEKEEEKDWKDRKDKDKKDRDKEKDREDRKEEDRLAGAVHVLRTEANALQALATLYSSNQTCRDGFSRTIDAITRHRNTGASGKVVFVGVGKSGWIAKKLVATFTSLGLPAVFLHPTEALHGDVGIVGDNDTVVMVTFSGKTPELLVLLPHLKPGCPLVLLTGPMTMETCAIARSRPDLVLLPAPIPETEASTFGVGAPTTSTTMAVAVGDALAFVASREMYSSSVAAVFARNHPGGAIGQSLHGRTVTR